MLPESQGGALHIDVPADLASLDGVRTRVVAAARGWGLPDVEALAVVTSEVVTNAIVHGARPRTWCAACSLPARSRWR